MTHHTLDSTTLSSALKLLNEHGFEGMAGALEILINEAMKIERNQFLEANPYERTDGRVGYANGYKSKSVKTRVGELSLDVPKTRNLPDGVEPFYPNCLERGIRSERALMLAVAEMYVQGVSTRKVTKVVEEMCGTQISSQQVSRVAKLLDEELGVWRNRPLGEYPYLIVDARYEKVRHGGKVLSVALLVAIGIDTEGLRTVLGVSVSLSEAEVHWREFLQSLVARGLHGLQLITSDDHAGLKAARAATFSGVAWQRCQFHLQQNALAYVPQLEMKSKVSADIRAIFNARDEAEAIRLLGITVESYREPAPKLAQWMEENIPEGLAVFQIPLSHRKRLRTSNLLERLNREIKRRTRVAGLFPNEASLLRLASAILIEVSEEWETGRVYICMDQT